MLCQLTSIHSVQAPWESGVKPLYIGPFCPLGGFQEAPWAWVSLQEVGNESGKLEVLCILWVGVPGTPTVTLIKSGGGLGFGTQQWPWWGGSALSPESAQEAVILCGNHTSLGDLRLRIPVSWNTRDYCSQSQHCRGGEQSPAQVRKRSDYSWEALTVLVTDPHSLEDVSAERWFLLLAWSAAASAESMLSGQCFPQSLSFSYPVLLCQWVVPKKRSISNTCECLKGRETTVKTRWQGGQCSEAVRKLVVSRAPSMGDGVDRR